MASWQCSILLHWDHYCIPCGKHSFWGTETSKPTNVKVVDIGRKHYFADKAATWGGLSRANSPLLCLSSSCLAAEADG